MEDAEDPLSGTTKLPVPIPMHREPDDHLEILRHRLADTPRYEQPRGYLQSVLREWSINTDTRGYVLINDALALDVPCNAKIAKQPTVTVGPIQSLLHAAKLTKYSGNGPASLEEAAKSIEMEWKAQREEAFDDTIYVVFLSPSDPDDYIALGGRRLYWLDDDVKNKEQKNDKNGLLHAIEYFDEHYSPAPDGLESRRSGHGAALSSYHFRVTRQYRLLADGGDVADVWSLPYRVRERSQLEAFRLCALLNELRELLHPGTTVHVEHASALSERTLHLRIITKQTIPHHLAIAEQHRKDVRLLDEDGQPHDAFGRLDGPPPYGIQYQIGTGTTAYLYMLWYLGQGFFLAFLVAIPLIYLNLQGGRLNDVGLVTGVGYPTLLSIGNVRPYERWAIYPILEIIICLILCATFISVHKTADRIEQEVDEGQATSEDYTIFVAKPPPTLGSGGAASAKHAVDTYRAFFENVASRAAPNVGAKLTTSTRSLYAIPEDATVSEVVLIKNTCYMELRQKLKSARAAIHGCAAREQWYEDGSEGDEKKAASLRAATEKAKTAFKAIEEEIQREIVTDKQFEVSAVFVSFNTVAMRDKALAELHAGAGGLRNTFPFSLFVSSPPNFKYKDMSGKECVAQLHCVPAREPDDYMWPNLFTVSKWRVIFVWIGYLSSVLFVIGCTFFVIFLQRVLALAPAYQGTFTNFDQMCDDPNFVANAPPAVVQEQCGLEASTVTYLADSAHAVMGVNGQSVGFGTKKNDEKWATYLADLIRLTPCSPDAVYRDDAVRNVKEANRAFAVSDDDHVLFPGCDFLNGTLDSAATDASQSLLWGRSGGQSGFVSDGWRSYCNFGLDPNVTKGQPLRMISQPYCLGAPTELNFSVSRAAAPFKMPGSTMSSGSSMPAVRGLGDAVAAEECYDTNCLRCLQLFHGCREASRNAASDAPYAGYVPVATVQSLLVTGIVTACGFIIYYAQQFCAMTGIGKPTTITHGERDFMIQMIFNLIFFVVFVVVYIYSGSRFGIVRNPFSTLGFTISISPQIWGFLMSYGLIVMVACFGFVPPMSNLAFRILARVALKVLPFPTQQLINELHEGYPWLPHYVLSYSNFVVLIGTCLSTTMPLALLVVSASCFVRYGIDRGYFLLRVYMKPAPIDGTLVKFCVRLLPFGLLAKVGAMYLHYVGTPAFHTVPFIIVLILAIIFCVVGTDLEAIKRLLGMTHVTHSQHRDAANFFTHQHLVRQGMIESYDPLGKEEGAALETKTGGPRRKEKKTAADKDPRAPATAVIKANSKIALLTGAPPPRLAKATSDPIPKPPSAEAEIEEKSKSVGPRLRKPRKRVKSVAGADRFKATISALARVDEEIGTTDEAMDRAAALVKTGGNDDKKSSSAWRPFVWRNPATLPIVTMCPNSGEAAQVRKNDLWTEHKSSHFGNARWSRASRLGGATEVHTFDSWVEVRAWMESNLRTPLTDAVSAGEKAVGTLGSALSTDGSGTPALYTYTGVPVTLLAPTDDSKQWVVTVSRDRGEFSNLHWKVLEAADRHDFDHLLRLHGCTDETIAARATEDKTEAELRQDRKADGTALWQVQTMAAELVLGGEGKECVWTRWVAVLRAGGSPVQMGGVFTNIAQRVDWGHPNNARADEGLMARLNGSHHLVAVAGTEGKLNANVTAFLRKGADWSEQFVYASPTWPTAWLASSEAPTDMLISHVAYYNHSWTLVFTHATTEAALKAAGVSGEQAVVQRVLVQPSWPADEVASLIADGYTITSAGRGRGGGEVASSSRVVVVVLTKSPSTIYPRSQKTFGSVESHVTFWRSPSMPWHRNWAAAGGVTIKASQTAGKTDENISLVHSMNPPEWFYRNEDAYTTDCAIMNVLDPDMASFWTSGSLTSEEAVTITIDLGATRTVDTVVVLWGDVEALPMAQSWSLVGGAAGSVANGPTDAETLITSPLGAPDVTETPDLFQRTIQAHVEDVSCSRVALASPKQLRVLQLRLATPQPKDKGGRRVGYSIRQVLVLGADQMAAEGVDSQHVTPRCP